MDPNVASKNNDPNMDSMPTSSNSLLESLVGLNSPSNNSTSNSSILLFDSLINSLTPSTNMPSTSSNSPFGPLMGLNFSIPEASTSSSNILLRTPRKIRSYTIGQKLEVIKFANENSINAANRKFGIDRKCIRTWRKSEETLLNLQESTMMTPLKKRRPGAGRKVKDMSFDEDLAKWMKNELAENRNPSRAHIQWKALEMAYNSGDVNQEFKASTGWLEKFLTRHNFRPRQPTPSEVLRMHGINYSRIPKEIEKNKNSGFAEYIQDLRRQNNYEHVYLAYKISILIDASGGICADGQMESETLLENDKLRISMIFTLRSDGHRLLPFIVLPQETINSSVVSNFSQQLHLIWSENSELDDELVPEYLQHVFGRNPICKRLLLWNIFGCQLSEELSQFLEKNQIGNMLIPDKFAEFKQLLDSRLDEVFKKELLEQYNNCRLNDVSTSNDNIGAPSMNSFLNCVISAWLAVEEKSIANLFITQDVKDAMSQLMPNGDQFSSIDNSFSNEISTVEKTYQDDYKKFLEKIVETIGSEGSTNGQSVDNNTLLQLFH